MEYFELGCLFMGVMLIAPELYKLVVAFVEEHK